MKDQSRLSNVFRAMSLLRHERDALERRRSHFEEYTVPFIKRQWKGVIEAVAEMEGALKAEGLIGQEDCLTHTFQPTVHEFADGFSWTIGLSRSGDEDGAPAEPRPGLVLEGSILEPVMKAAFKDQDAAFETKRIEPFQKIFDVWLAHQLVERDPAELRETPHRVTLTARQALLPSPGGGGH